MSETPDLTAALAWAEDDRYQPDNSKHRSVLAARIRAQALALSEKEAVFPRGQCPSCGYPKEDPVEGYVGMKARAEAAESARDDYHKKACDIADQRDRAESERTEWVKRGERAEALNDELRGELEAARKELAEAMSAFKSADEFLNKAEKERDEARKEVEHLKAVILENKEGALTTNILRHWPREKIESFAGHLYGVDALKAENALLTSRLNALAPVIEGAEIHRRDCGYSACPVCAPLAALDQGEKKS